jgi:hypothetical protein
LQLEDSLRVMTNGKFRQEMPSLASGKKISKIALALYCKKDFK